MARVVTLDFTFLEQRTGHNLYFCYKCPYLTYWVGCFSMLRPDRTPQYNMTATLIRIRQVQSGSGSSKI